ncbi:SDR family NAD(P)-dependent oxidoreductase [Peribacillus butanolivorans]|uniref:SDR family NAD(P)-dependent oxidoreductase n=1 Tax=Peribacillus butanolivorans TaxID=421767 RepID=UPI00207C1C19|nr:SDR family NAD(P)-dependent oxidoreductase [Peribacillus butanolivorans]MCO0599559.1 SDR family NAD(P)-dependent oxidoreductase [Peribacillus butanolivorans]
MKTIAVIGAGPGLGLSIAKRFGSEQFNVALIARNKEKLSAMVEELKGLNIESKYYLADLRNLEQLKKALDDAKADFNNIDVLEFSPYPGPKSFIPTLDVTAENMTEQINYFLLPAIEAVQSVLPGMQKKGAGAILFTTGISAMHPIPQLGNAGIVMAGLRNYATNLHNILKEQSIYVGHLSIGTLIEKGTEGDPDLIADMWYNQYATQPYFEAVYPTKN